METLSVSSEAETVFGTLFAGPLGLKGLNQPSNFVIGADAQTPGQ
jgi:hypothetical protein